MNFKSILPEKIGFKEIAIIVAALLLVSGGGAFIFKLLQGGSGTTGNINTNSARKTPILTAQILTA